MTSGQSKDPGRTNLSIQVLELFAAISPVFLVGPRDKFILL